MAYTIIRFVFVDSTCSKRTGVEKAMYQIEEAIKKAKIEKPDDEAAVGELQRLLDNGRRTLMPANDSQSSRHSIPTQPEQTQSSDESLDDVENPLQLLARASDLRQPSQQSTSPSLTPSTRINDSVQTVSNVTRFFLPMKATPDVDGIRGIEGLDPIEIGLVAPEEARFLFAL
jgi:Mg2+ and Co2+ transporter CorA